MKFLKFWKSNEALSEVTEKWNNYVLMWNFFLVKRFHNGDVDELLRNKLP